MGYPHLIWNPFLWGRYRVYSPKNILTSLGKGVCLDIEQQHSASHRHPLCLSENEWDELSSGQLSSYNLDDVLAVTRGLEYLQKQSGGIVINVLARNVAHSIPALKQNVEGLVPFFNKDSEEKLSLVIFENDSEDGTREIFQAWADEEAHREDLKYTVDLVSCGGDNPNCELGIVDRYDANLFADPNASGVGKLGEFRQIMLEYIIGKEEYKDFSHMIVLDVDLGVSVSPLGLLHTLGWKNDIAQTHAVASSSSQIWPGTMGSILPPYDFSAFRPKATESNERIRAMHRSFCEITPAGDRWRNMCDACSPMQLFMIQQANDIITNHHGGGLYEVVSAFNGLAMYPMSLLRERGYRARYNAGNDGQRCEHVGFNTSLQKHMYVNPKWTMKLKAEKPGGPTGFRGVQALFLAVIGRPIVMLSIVGGQLIFYYAIVCACWVLGMSGRSLFELMSMSQEVLVHR